MTGHSGDRCKGRRLAAFQGEFLRILRLFTFRSLGACRKFVTNVGVGRVAGVRRTPAVF